MKKSKYILLLVGMLICALVYFQDSEGNDDAITCHPTSYSKDRAEWESKYFGAPATYEQTQKIQQTIQTQLKKRASGPYRDAGVMEWDELGPDNIGGRIRGIAFHPTNNQIIFIGGTSGGIWKSTNAGSSWFQLTPPQWAYPITSIQVDPDDPDVIYAATGEARPGGLRYAGKGILKTTNGGNTWINIKVLDTDSIPFLSKIFDSSHTKFNTFACGGETGSFGPTSATAYKSVDGGINWTRIYYIGGYDKVFYDMEINPDSPEIMYLGSADNIYKTSDGGQNWNSEIGPNSNDIQTLPFRIPRRCELDICNSDPDVVWVLRHTYTRYPANLDEPDSTFSEIWKTTDDGTNWDMIDFTFQYDSLTSSVSAQNILGKQGNYDNTIWVDPSDCDRAILGGIDLWKYDNGLERISIWQDDIGGCHNNENNSVHADQHMIIPAINYNGSSGNQVYFGNDGGLYRSNNIWSASLNSGWISLVNGLPITQLYALDVNVTGHLLYAGSQDNSYFFRDNGYSSSQNWSVFCSGDGGHGARLPNSQVIISSIQWGEFFISDDSGESFYPFLELENLGNVQFIAPMEQHPITNVIYMGGDRLYSKPPLVNASATAVSDTIENRHPITAIAFSSTNPLLMYIGYNNGVVQKSINGGGSWDPVTPPGSPSAMVTDIDVARSNDNHVAITYGDGYRINGLFTTANGGSSWQVRTDSVSLIHLSVTHHPENPDWLYIGTSDGIFASEDNGDKWSITPFYNENEGPVTTMVVELIWQGDGAWYPYYLLAATHGRGAWRTKFPVRQKYYIDKTCEYCGLGTWEHPFQSFTEAVDQVGTGVTLEFKTGGDYDEVSSELIVEKRLTIKKHPLSSNVTIK